VSKEKLHGSRISRWRVAGGTQPELPTAAGADKNISANQLVFNKYGQKRFLSTVSVNGYKATLKMLNLERDLRSQAEQAPSIITVAQK
jgi:hypothetical protein